MSKAIIFLADGMADVPLKELGGKTPLEAVNTPGMDAIAANGVNGTMLTLPGGLPTSSDVANMSVLGFDPVNNYPGRGPIEAISQGIELEPEDVAWRCNLVTVSPEGIMADYSAGHIDNEISSQLMKDLQKEFGSDKVTFYPGVSYRNLLILHGKEFSKQVDYSKPDSSHGINVAELGLKPIVPAALHTVEFLTELSKKCHDFLINHPLSKSGKSVATDIWPWSPGHAPALREFSQLYNGKSGAIISAVDVIRGLGKASKMTVIEVPGATGFIDTNYAGKAAAAIEAIKDHDFVYVHLEAIDECSHMGDLKLKMRAIEEFDKNIVQVVMKALQGQDVNFAILPDHPVPIELRKHTRVPVPVAICGPSFQSDGIKHYSEQLALQGSLGQLSGNQLMLMVLGLDKK